MNSWGFCQEPTYFEETCTLANVLLLDLVRTVHNLCSTCTSDAVVVRLANAADCGDACFLQKVLCEVRHTPLGEYEIGLGCNDLITPIADIPGETKKNGYTQK